jgi:hypothetical protein
MKRKCPWCGQHYDTAKSESSIYCAKNPRRGKGASKIKPSIVRILSLTWKDHAELIRQIEATA